MAVLTEQQRETTQVRYTEVRAWTALRWSAYSLRWSLLDMCRILCAHGLKVLGLMNIKISTTYYIFKRWTREARNGSIQDRQGRNVIENPKREAQLWYKFLSHKFHTWQIKQPTQQSVV